METSKLKLGDTVELIAVSTGAVSSIGVEGDEEDKLYRLVMYAHVGSGPVNAQTSEYLEVKKEMELYGEEGPDGREYRFYNVLWVEREEGVAYRRAAGRVPKAIWDANCTPLTKIILG
ncbi:hypothetical protein J4E86_001614 [Alternaria arbusti]|uniref:uncharacterized protein n=1 Tax=Alternaria arbusti TaxID=232088 RepID=UPI0022203C96|nr:uncharacterized protein J4E86_001614 [Alternaria arbusti]KAI4959995.1 hypothetical protein J4E86_001614 [Alternaria arbusti]